MRVRVFFVKMVVGLVSVMLFWATAGAAGFPDRPIQILLGFPVGNMNDPMDRAIAKPLSKILGQPVIVQNIAGGGGALVLGRVKTEKPDGYALFQTGSNLFSQVPLTRVAPFDPLKDFAYLGSHARFSHYLLCLSDSPWKTFEELIQYAKKNPKKIRYGTSGVGSSMHIFMEYVAIKENIQWIHIPYNSGAEASTAVMGGHAELAAISMGLELEHVKTGRLRALVCLNDKRTPLLPDLPTVVEKGYDFYCTSFTTWAVPAATPKDIQKILEKALLQAFADPEVKDVIHKVNLFYAPIGAEETTKAIFEDHRKYGDLMKKLGLGIYKK